jgi:predicted outer membrane protein
LFDEEKTVMNRSLIRRLSLVGACAAPLAMTNPLFAQATAEQPVRDNAAQNAAQDDAPRDNRDNAADPQTRPRNEADQDRAQRQAGEHAQAGHKLDDRTLAALLLIGNQKEVAVSRLAAARAQNPEVKQFAQEMAQAHGQFISRLAQVAGARERSTDGAANPFSPQRDPAGRVAENAADPIATANDPARAQARIDARPRTQPGQDDARARQDWQRYDLGASPIVTFDREFAEQCLQSAEKFLGQQQGAEFDRWFMALQLVEHMGMRAKLQVAQRHATGELRALVDQGLQTTDQHIRQAEQVMRQLSQAGNAAQTGARPGAVNQ